jgi:hypothetical protein
VAQGEADHQAHIGHHPWQEADRLVIARDRREEGSEEVGAAEADEVEQAAMDTGRGHIQDLGAGRHAAVLRDRRIAGLHQGHRRPDEDTAGASHHRGEADVVEAAEEEVAEVGAEEARVTVRTAAEARGTVAGVGVVDRGLIGMDRRPWKRASRRP